MIGPPDNSSTLRELEQFLTLPAPREIPPSLKKRLKVMKGSWATTVFGLLFGTFGLVFCFLFLPVRQIDDWRLEASEAVAVTGEVVTNEETNMSINGVSVRKVEVDFEGDGGNQRSTGFITGRGPEVGAPHVVMVHPGDPELSCPQGMRLSRGSLASSFVLLFPLVGYGLVSAPWWARARRLQLLRQGKLVQARVLAFERTNTEINGQNVYKFTVQLQREPGTMEIRRHLSTEVEAMIDAKERGGNIRLVQHPTRPKRVVVLDGWI